MKSDEYVKFLTEQLVRYMETPREERRSNRLKQKEARPPFRNQLFGQIPDAIENYVTQFRNLLRKKQK